MKRLLWGGFACLVVGAVIGLTFLYGSRVLSPSYVDVRVGPVGVVSDATGSDWHFSMWVCLHRVDGEWRCVG